MHTPPRLRSLGICAHLSGDRVALFDPLGVSPSARDGSLVLGADEWHFARGFDGRTSAAELAIRYANETAFPVDVLQIHELAQRLSKEHALEDELFERALAREFDVFRRHERRAPNGAGSEYPSDPFDLRLRLGGVVADDWDMPPLAGALGLWAPGGPLPSAASLYGRAWAAVRHGQSRVERVVLLGSVGAPLDQLLVPLAKPFDTPLGTVDVDREALTHLGVLPGRAQLAHRSTGVLERHALFVRLLFPRATIVPILVTALELERDPTDDTRVAPALEGLERVARLPGTLFVAASDLFHQRRPNGQGAAAPGSAITRADRAQMQAAEDLDPRAFAVAALEDGDAARAAQAAAPYLLLSHLTAQAARTGEPCRATNLGYLQCPTPGALFTAAASVFYREMVP